MSIETAPEVLPKGTVVKVRGIPYELLVDTPSTGRAMTEENGAALNVPVLSDLTEDQSRLT